MMAWIMYSRSPQVGRARRVGGNTDHLPQSSAEVKERVESYLYSPSAPLWYVTEKNFTSSAQTHLSLFAASVWSRGRTGEVGVSGAATPGSILGSKINILNAIFHIRHSTDFKILSQNNQ